MQKFGLYNTKRDFSKTSEPAGKRAGSSPSRLRFVVQKHAAKRLHFDFRLELDGALKSWAVTRGPSMDPADKRLAVEVEDHPVAYGDFEGTIPAGQYGGGTVQLWDRGYWQPETGNPESSLKKGELKFQLFGERLTGSWVLVRMRKDRTNSKRNNWLLIKHRDSSNSDKETKADKKRSSELLKVDASIASGRTMAQIAAGKGSAPTRFFTGNGKAKAETRHVTAAETPQPARKRAAEKSVRHLPAFVEPELCKLMEQPPQGSEWLHEVKLDGYRLQLRVANGKATFKTRKGLDWTARFSAIATAARELPPCIIDGEMVALDAEGNPNFSSLQAALAENRADELVFFAFDLLFLEQQDLRNYSLVERKEQLQKLLSRLGNEHLRYVDHVFGDGAAILKSACEQKLEGVISKRSTAIYSSGRGGDWVKSKCRAGHEVVIGGMTTEGGQLRSLLAGVMRNRQLVYVGRVGTGFSAATSRRVLPKLKAATSSDNPFHGMTAPRKATNVTWLKPKFVAEIEFAGWTGGGMVRQAAFKGLRDDKPAIEVQAETPVADAEPARITSKSARRKKRTVASRAVTRAGSHDSASIAGVEISHASKVLWPAGETAAVNKLQLAEYYLSVSEWMLPHIEGRPCSIVRAPDGIKGEQFFQRHAMAGSSSALSTIKLAGDHKPYLLLDTAEALAAVAQLGGMELHPGNGVPNRPELPGRLVFDIDPSIEVEFKWVIKAALELRDRLEQVGLTGFCKTTGGKGLHVVVPLSLSKGSKTSAGSWPQAKLFAQTLCAQMAGDSPDRYLINMSKAQRRNRIFLDYLRNDRLATAVAPLSPRARPGATVSMPLNWAQVRAGLDPKAFTVTTSQAALKKMPWEDYFNVAGSLLNAMKALVKIHSKHAA